MKHAGSSVLLVVALGCSGDPILEHQFDSEHYEYYASEKVCSEVPDLLEATHNLLSSYIGSEPTGTIVYRQESRSGEGCEGNGACYRDGVIHSVFPVHPHEMVHAISDAVGDPPFFLEEGIADVLGCIGWSGWPTVLEKDLVVGELFSNDAFVSRRDEDLLGTYAIAASFVRFLLDLGGKETFWEFYASVPFAASSQDVLNALTTHYEMDGDLIVSQWDDQIESADLHCINLLLCDAAPLQSGTLSSAPCSTSLFGDLRRTFEIESETISFRTDLGEGAGPGAALIESCDGGRIGPGRMNLGTPSLRDSSSRRSTLWHIRATPGTYGWSTSFVHGSYDVETLGDETFTLTADNRAVLLGRFLDGSVSHDFTASIGGQLYASQVTDGDSPPFDIEVCLNTDCTTIVLEGGIPSVDLIPVNAGDVLAVTVSAPTFDGATGAAIALRPSP